MRCFFLTLLSSQVSTRLVYKLRFHVLEGEVQIPCLTICIYLLLLILLYGILLAFVSIRMLTFSHHRRVRPGILLQVGHPGESKLT